MGAEKKGESGKNDEGMLNRGRMSTDSKIGYRGLREQGYRRNEQGDMQNKDMRDIQPSLDLLGHADNKRMRGTEVF